MNLPAWLLQRVASADSGTSPSPGPAPTGMINYAVHTGNAFNTDNFTAQLAYSGQRTVLVCTAFESHTSQAVVTKVNEQEATMDLHPYNVGTLRTQTLNTDVSGSNLSINTSAKNYFTYAIVEFDKPRTLVYGQFADRSKTNSPTVTLCPSVAGTKDDLALAIGYERTGAVENSIAGLSPGWELKAFAPQEQSAQTVTIAARILDGNQSGECQITYSNPQAQNSCGVQVVVKS